jgi:phosphoglycerate dehydrogenase-like enzyme
LKALIYPYWSQQDVDGVRAAFPDVEIVAVKAESDAIREIADADVAFGAFSRPIFLAAKKLRWIQAHGAGVEWTAGVPELIESDVVLTNTRGAHAATIADHAFAMLLTFTRGLRQLEVSQNQHTWTRPTGIRFIGLSGLTLGVIGLGNIGRAMAKRGFGFDMRVIAVDANDVPKPEYVEDLWRLDRLPELLRESDAVMVATPITAETRGMLGPDQLALMKPTAFLMVLSRGGIVDQHALAEALKAGRLAGAGLDVTAPEPLPSDSELWAAPNIIITPHCSGASRQTNEMTWGFFKDNLRRFIAGETLDNLVDMRRGY